MAKSYNVNTGKDFAYSLVRTHNFSSDYEEDEYVFYEYLRQKYPKVLEAAREAVQINKKNREEKRRNGIQ